MGTRIFVTLSFVCFFVVTFFPKPQGTGKASRRPSVGVCSGSHAPRANNSSISRPTSTTGAQLANENPEQPCPETFKTLSAPAHKMPGVKQTLVHEHERQGGEVVLGLSGFLPVLNFVKCPPPSSPFSGSPVWLTWPNICWERSP